ncbi:MAG TPA: hypothetical protein VK184_07855 [Nostocaceae cyanobacterium]|nr:hypothetical protein [Nostocaceae cyanobacterium]
MYDRQHRKGQSSSQSAYTPAKNQFAPSKFMVQAKQEERQPVSAEEYEQIKASDGNYFDSSIVTNRPTPKIPRVQPKLKIGQVGDKYEQEADQVAQKVVQSIDTAKTSTVQAKEEQEDKKPANSQEEEQKKKEEEDDNIPKGGIGFKVPNIKPSGNREGTVR